MALVDGGFNLIRGCACNRVLLWPTREIAPGHSNQNHTPGLCIANCRAVCLGTETPRDMRLRGSRQHLAWRFSCGAAGRDCRVGWDRMDGWMAWHGMGWDGMGWDAGL